MGSIFLRDWAYETRGSTTGIYNQSVLRLNHPDRSPDIVYSRRWTDDANAYRIKGTVFGAGGIATHGSLSPHDRHCVLVAAGPSFKKGEVSPIQSSAVDIAPTILRLFGQKAELDGRVLREGLLNGPSPGDVAVHVNRLDGGEDAPITLVEIAGKTYIGI